MTTYENPGQYWENRLADRFDVTGVGYAALGRRYNEVMYAARLRALERALAGIGRGLAGARVIDIGCGSGIYTDYCARNGVVDYVGLDIAEVSVTLLRRSFPHFHFEQLDITGPSPELPSDRNIALVADVFFHVVLDDLFARALSNVCASLAPGGLLIVSDNFGPRTLQTAPHVRFRSLDEYQRHLERAGLRIALIQPIFALLHPPAHDTGAILPWRAYALFWRYGWRFARIPLIDRLLPVVLDGLDAKFALSRWGMSAPNSKWLVAVKETVGDTPRVR